MIRQLLTQIGVLAPLVTLIACIPLAGIFFGDDAFRKSKITLTMSLALSIFSVIAACIVRPTADMDAYHVALACYIIAAGVSVIAFVLLYPKTQRKIRRVYISSGVRKLMNDALQSDDSTVVATDEYFPQEEKVAEEVEN